MSDKDIILKHITAACDRVGKLLKYNFDKTIFESNSINESGDEVEEIDLLSHNIFEEEIRECKLIGGMVSEECANAIIWNQQAPYIITIDPLDGSSNNSLNITIGSIFSIFKVQNVITENSFLQQGSAIFMAGYSLYGPSSSLIVADDDGVKQYQILNGELRFFTNLECPKLGGVFSMNPSNYCTWSKFDQDLYSECISNYSSFRYVGSLVAEVHRLLHKGGFFAYPSDHKNTKGKLRLIYECIPMAYIVTKAGGMGYCGIKNLLNIIPKKLHQKSPLYLGSKEIMLDKFSR